MPSTTVNGRHLLKNYPSGYPIPGTTTIYDTSERLDLDTVPLNGGVLAKLVVLSIDPYLRNTIKGNAPGSVQLGQPLTGFGIVKVIRSEVPAHSTGDYLSVNGLYHQEYSIFTKDQLSSAELLKADNRLPLSVHLGAAGPTGLTAFAGWKEFAKVKKGDTVFVSTAAGAVGSLVVQLAKLESLKVIGSAGSDEKVKFLKELGVDVAFNYKTTDLRDVLKKEGPIDLYWDNVGGDTLDAALENASTGARVIICGSISSYNHAATSAGVKNLLHLTSKEINLYGLSYFALAPKYDAEFKKTVIPKLADGTFKYLEDRKFGLDQAPQAMLDVQNGGNTGKSVIILSDD
ncbi:alcohol dehydrogenase [Pterulicium gracile]|uniref:Alcohol dehydrogenase n=1 Tax=Pterulicium gracile TaxID=1884261 RepID=A0A5C3QUE8_9AGAR|nr:alcohol dehydrogenase [Pterula gracilis]